VFGLANRLMHFINLPFVYQFLLSAALSLFVYLVLQILVVNDPFVVRLFQKARSIVVRKSI